MSSLPKILKSSTILTSWRGYPFGTKERAKALGIEVWSTFKNVKATSDLWETKLQVVSENEPWKPLGLKDLDEFIQAVCGVPVDETRKKKRRDEETQHAAILQQEPVLPVGRPRKDRAIEMARECKSPGDGDAASNLYEKENCTNLPLPTGNSSARRIARLRRDHPEIATRLEQGEFPSVAAAVRVSRGEPMTPPRKKATDLEILQRVWMRTSIEELRREYLLRLSRQRDLQPDLPES